MASSLHRPLLVLAWLLPAGILVQAALAGQAWFVRPELFGLHGGLGHGVLGLALACAALAWLSRRGRAVPILSVLLVLGLVAQTGLGYVGHRTGVATASALHVPLGVTLLGLSVAIAVLVTVTRPVAGDEGQDAEPPASDVARA